DLLCWRGYALYDCAAEFRAFWLESKLREEGLAPPQQQQPPAAPAAAAAPPPPPPPPQQQQQQRPEGDVDMGEGQRVRQAPVSYRIVPLPVRPCTLEGLRAAYGSGCPEPSACRPPAASVAAVAAPGADGRPAASSAPPMGAGEPRSGGAAAVPAVSDGGGASYDDCVDFVRDGLYFLHRQGHYAPGAAASPLALLWKDLGCSRYLIDTDAKGLPLEHQ
ncbi:Snurportin-1, partial [Tetrabaena socialis]